LHSLALSYVAVHEPLAFVLSTVFECDFFPEFPVPVVVLLIAEVKISQLLTNRLYIFIKIVWISLVVGWAV